MIAGCQSRICQEPKTGTVRGVSPRKFILAHFDDLCNSCVAKNSEAGSFSRSIDSLEPNPDIGHALSRGCDPKSGRRVQDAAVQSAQQAVGSKAGTFAEENAPQSLGQIEPLASEHGTRGARFLPRSLRSALEVVGLVLTTRERLLLFRYFVT